MALENAQIFGIAAPGEEAAVDFRMQRLYPPGQDFRKPGDIADIPNRQTRCLERLGSAARRDELHSERVQRRRELGDAGLFRHRQKGTADGGEHQCFEKDMQGIAYGGRGEVTPDRGVT